MEPKLISGGLAVDERGVVRFVNDFNFEGVKRFYVLENHEVGYIRAWHGHYKEAKYISVISGSAIIGTVDITKEYSEPTRFILSEHKPSVLYVPPGYANGSMALVPNTKIIHFSTMTLEESIGDDVRFGTGEFSDIWRIEYR